MTDLLLSASLLEESLHRLTREFELFAPRRSGVSARFAPASAAEALSALDQPPHAPVKPLFLPQKEDLLHFSHKDGDPRQDGQVPRGLDRPRLVLGVRPCEARAMMGLDEVFLADGRPADVYWRRKREMTLLIGLACAHPGATCFCTAAGGDPHGVLGLDALLVDLGGRYLLTGVSARARRLWPDAPAAGPGDRAKAALAAAQTKAGLDDSALPMSALWRADLLSACGLPLWERLAERCLQCGICAFACPCCHCFDILDETSGETSRRLRVWDSCMSQRFTRQASGKNPRAAKSQRIRQRFLHKLKYLPMRGRAPGCVGCGRCVGGCPVNIDIRLVAKAMEAGLSMVEVGAGDA